MLFRSDMIVITTSKKRDWVDTQQIQKQQSILSLDSHKSLEKSD